MRCLERLAAGAGLHRLVQRLGRRHICSGPRDAALRTVLGERRRRYLETDMNMPTVFSIAGRGTHKSLTVPLGWRRGYG